jgi:hypothetical protein
LLNTTEQKLLSCYYFSIIHVADIETDAAEQQDHMGAAIKIATTTSH